MKATHSITTIVFRLKNLSLFEFLFLTPGPYRRIVFIRIHYLTERNIVDAWLKNNKSAHQIEIFCERILHSTALKSQAHIDFDLPRRGLSWLFGEMKDNGETCVVIVK